MKTKEDQLHEILEIYLPRKMPNKGALERRLLMLLRSIGKKTA